MIKYILLAAVMLANTACVSSALRDRARNKLKEAGYIKMADGTYQKIVPGPYFERVNDDGQVEVVEGLPDIDTTTVGKEVGWLTSVGAGVADASIAASLAAGVVWVAGEAIDALSDREASISIVGDGNQIGDGGNNIGDDNSGGGGDELSDETKSKLEKL